MAWKEPGNMTGLVDYFTYLNDVTNAKFFPFIIIALFIILFTGLLYTKRKAINSFLVASFVCAVISIIVRTIGLVSDGFMTTWIVVTAALMGYLIFTRSKS